MKSKIALLCVLGLSLFAVQAVIAADVNPGGPPNVLQIFREEVKPGRTAAHEKFEANWPKAFAKANWPTNYLAVVSTTGPNEAWFMTPYDSFAAWEKDQNDTEKNRPLQDTLDKLSHQDAEFLSGVRSLVCVLRKDLGYRSDTINVAKGRFFRVLIFRVRPGHDGEFAEAAGIVRAANEKVNTDAPYAVYQVAGGMPGPTFFVFAPMKSLAEIDAAMGRAKAVGEAEGEEGQKKLQKLSADALLSVETQIFAFRPKMSYVSKDFAAVDPEYWTPKPEPQTPSKSKSEQAKPAEKKP